MNVDFEKQTLGELLPDELLSELKTLTEMLNMSIELFLQKVLNGECSKYRDNWGHPIRSQKAIYLAGNNPAEKQAWKAAGWKGEPPFFRKECYFLYNCSMYGQPYRAIILDGKFVKTPIENVKLL